MVEIQDLVSRLESMQDNLVITVVLLLIVLIFFIIIFKLLTRKSKKRSPLSEYPIGPNTGGANIRGESTWSSRVLKK
jgi:NADH:ubiquinone oxidoreductase subunit 3 (subunit A)